MSILGHARKTKARSISQWLLLSLRIQVYCH